MKGQMSVIHITIFTNMTLILAKLFPPTSFLIINFVHFPISIKVIIGTPGRQHEKLLIKVVGLEESKLDVAETG